MISRATKGRVRGIATCPHCDDLFEIRRYGQQYCSQACFRSPRLGPPRPLLKDLLPLRACAECGSTFQPIAYRHRACGTKECARAANARRERDRGRKKARVERHCAQCGDAFTPVYGDKRRRFCQERCDRRFGRVRARRGRNLRRLLVGGTGLRRSDLPPEYVATVEMLHKFNQVVDQSRKGTLDDNTGGTNDYYQCQGDPD